MPQLGYWPHLMLDCYKCKSSKLDDMKTIYTFLEQLTTTLDMNMLAKPYVMRNDTATDYGVTGFVVIAESHISIHTFPKEKYFTMDIYSCKPFDKEKVVPLVSSFFESKDMDQHYVERGRFPAKTPIEIAALK